MHGPKGGGLDLRVVTLTMDRNGGYRPCVDGVDPFQVITGESLKGMGGRATYDDPSENGDEQVSFNILPQSQQPMAWQVESAAAQSVESRQAAG